MMKMMPISKLYLCFTTAILVAVSTHARMFRVQPFINKSETGIPELIIDDKSDSINIYEITLKSFLISINSTVEKLNLLSDKLFDEFPNIQNRILEHIRNLERMIPKGCDGYTYCDESEMELYLNELEQCKEYLPKREQFIISYEIIRENILQKFNYDKLIFDKSLESLINNYNATKINYSLKLTEHIYKNNNESVNNWKRQAINNLREQEKDIWNNLHNLINNVNEYFFSINKFEKNIYGNLNRNMTSLICCAKSLYLSLFGIRCKNTDATTSSTTTELPSTEETTGITFDSYEDDYSLNSWWRNSS